MRVVVLSIAIVACMGVAPVVHAHGGTGGPVGKQYVEKEDRGYLVRIGVDPAHLVRGSDVQIDVALLENPGSREWSHAAYDRVTLSVVRNGAPVIERQGVRSPSGPVFFVTAFERAGVHELRLSFEKAGSVIASAELPVSIVGSVRAGWVVGMVSTYIQVLMVFAFLVFLTVHLFDRAAGSPSRA